MEASDKRFAVFSFRTRDFPEDASGIISHCIEMILVHPIAESSGSDELQVYRRCHCHAVSQLRQAAFGGAGFGASPLTLIPNDAFRILDCFCLRLCNFFGFYRMPVLVSFAPNWCVINCTLRQLFTVFIATQVHHPGSPAEIQFPQTGQYCIIPIPTHHMHSR